MEWFLGCLGRAIDGPRSTLGDVLTKARFWEAPAGHRSERASDASSSTACSMGFEGKLTTSKYAKLAKCSQDTALRDILQLVERGILLRGPEGGRSTNYLLAPP